MNIKTRAWRFSMAAGLTTLMLGMTSPVEATTTPLIFSDCGNGVGCASFLSNVNGDFDNSYTFDLTSASGFGAAAIELDLTTFSSIANFNMGLWQGSTNLANGMIFTYDNLTSGSYYLRLTGSTAAGGGFYAGVAMLAPVPETSTWLMILIGISLVGLALRRKPGRGEFEFIAA